MDDVRRLRRFLLVVLPAAALLLTGCLPPQADFEFGFGTNRIKGFINVSPSQKADGPPIVVIYKYHHKFVSLEEGGPGLVHPTAHVVQVTRTGAYSIDMPADVVSVDILFIAPGRLTDTFRFNRQLGVGEITYKATLVPMEDWKSHFYTFLSPQLENLIVESRYRLSPRDQQVLSHWLTVQNKRLGGGKKQSGAKS